MGGASWVYHTVAWEFRSGVLLLASVTRNRFAVDLIFRGVICVGDDGMTGLLCLWACSTKRARFCHGIHVVYKE
jgi:hypothetical protein